jgi:xanthine dehydrogenase YagT iron-sulfur-binding subunit
MMQLPDELELSRRGVLVAGASAAAAAAASTPSTAKAQAMERATIAQVTIEVNGKARALEMDTRTTLLDALREHLHLTGTK